MIGKGNRSRAVIDAMQETGAVYFVAVGGAGALYGQCVLEAEVIAFPELGAEAVFRIKVKDFPCFVGIDTKVNDIYSIS